MVLGSVGAPCPGRGEGGDCNTCGSVEGCEAAVLFEHSGVGGVLCLNVVRVELAPRLETTAEQDTAEALTAGSFTPKVALGGELLVGQGRMHCVDMFAKRVAAAPIPHAWAAERARLVGGGMGWHSAGLVAAGLNGGDTG